MAALNLSAASQWGCRAALEVARDKLQQLFPRR